MTEPSTRLVIDNSSGMLLTTLEMQLNDGQYMNFRLRLKEGPDRTIHQTELAVLKQAEKLIGLILEQGGISD